MSQERFDPLADIHPVLVLQALRKHWLASISIAFAVFVSSVFYTLGQTKVYRATATVHIDPNPPRPLGRDVQGVVDMGVGSFWANKEYYATQYRIIAGRAVAEETVRRLGLQHDFRFMANTAPGQPDPEPTTPPPSIENAAAEVLRRLRVEPVEESRLVTVTFDDADRERATRVLAALLDVYLERNVDQVVASTASASEWLGDQVGKLKEDLESSEMALHDYKKAKRILSVSLDEQSSMLREEMQQLNQALTEVQTRREGLRARHHELAKISTEDAENVPVAELVNNPLLSSLRVDYVQMKAERAALVGLGKGPKHPDVVAADARVSASESALLAEIRNVKGAVKSDLDAATREASGLDALFERAKQRALDLNMLEIEYRRLERNKQNTEKLYSLVLERSKESDLTGLMRFNNITIAEAPIIQRTPVKPRLPINVAIGLLGGVVLGLGFALGRELLDRRIRSPDDLEEVLGLAFFGLLPRVERDARSRVDSASPAELTAHFAPSGPLAEAARGIRTNLLFANPDQPFRRVLVTSASPGDGKTMTASTLAVVLAQTGRRVLLIDCDLRRSRLHRVFGVPNDFGVTTSLVGDPADVPCVETEVPNLSLLPAGPHIATPSEALQSASFANLLEALGERYDTIVLDSPPSAVVTDAVILARQVDATVLVARAAKTSRDVIRRAIRALRDVGARLAGCVLNDADLQRRGYGYYYYRHYGYGYGESEFDKGATPPP